MTTHDKVVLRIAREQLKKGFGISIGKRVVARKKIQDKLRSEFPNIRILLGCHKVDLTTIDRKKIIYHKFDNGAVIDQSKGG